MESDGNIKRGPEPAPSATFADDALAVRYDYSWLTSIARPMLISVMTGCLTIGVLAFLRYAIAGIPIMYTSFMVLLTVIATIMGCVSTTWLGQPGQRMKRNAGLRAAEFGILLALTRFLSWLTVGNWPSLQLFLTRPLDAVLDGPFIISALIVGLAWSMASAITSDFLKISLQPDEIYAAQQRTGRSDEDPTPPNYTDRRGVLGGFVSKWVAGGVLLVLLSAGTQIEPSTNGFFAIGRQNIDSVVIVGTVLYFLTGLVLISQGQFAVLRARWTLEKVPSSESVVRNWPLYAMMMIGGIGVIATMLPFGGTFYFARILSTIIQAIYFTLATLMQIVLGLFGMLLALLMGEPPPEPEAPAPAQIQPFQMPEPQPEGAGLPPWLGGTIFWILISLLLGYALYIYLSGRGVNLTWLRNFVSLLITRIKELFGAYDEWRVKQRLSLRRENNRHAEGTQDGNWIKRLRLSNLTPDQQVRYFYMTMLEEAKEAGIGRYGAETPFQYEPRLVDLLHAPPAKDLLSSEDSDEASESKSEEGDVREQQMNTEGRPIAEGEEEASEEEVASTSTHLHALTDAFVHVRYAGKSVDQSALSSLKSTWEVLKERIGRATRAPSEDDRQLP